MQNSGRPQPQYPVEAVDRALRLLALFREQPELRLSEVRERLKVGQSTAHRLMAMMVYHGFATQDPRTRVYRAGPVLHEVGLAVVRNLDLRAVGRPILARLAEETGETVHLGTLEGASVRYLDCIESPAVLRVGSRVGQFSPAHATSLGKAILAAMPADAVRAVFPADQLPAATPRTIGTFTDLLAELDRVRDSGYARNAGEMVDGVCSVAVAVVHPVRGVVGALSVAAPLTRASDERMQSHAQRLQAAAAELAAAL